MQPGVSATTEIITGIGSSAPVLVFNPIAGTYGGAYPSQQPSILAFVTGTVTYNIEVTGDDVTVTGYNAAAGNWQAIPQQAGVSISSVNTLGAVVTAIRARTLTGTTGTLVFQFVQFTGGGA